MMRPYTDSVGSLLLTIVVVVSASMPQVVRSGFCALLNLMCSDGFVDFGPLLELVASIVAAH